MGTSLYFQKGLEHDPKMIGERKTTSLVLDVTRITRGSSVDADDAA